MSGIADPDDAPTPAERRLGEHLELLRVEDRHQSADLVHHVVRAARRQRLLRRPLLVIGHFAAIVGDGLRLLMGSTPRRQP